MQNLPFSQSCENNKAPILEVLREAFADRDAVLEIASGTGQHACHFAAGMPWLQWQPTEIPQSMSVLMPRCVDYGGDNLQPPLSLDVRDAPWEVPVPGAVFTANSLHIMAMSAVQALFAGLGLYSGEDLVLAVYGPFNYRGEYSSASNARFDQWLAQQHPESAIRHFERVQELAADAGLALQADFEMPANNRLLLWRKGG